MIRKFCIAALVLAAGAASAQQRQIAQLDAHGNLDALIAKHAAAYGVPENLVRRVIARESGGNPRVVSAGNFGLMQIKLGTARAMGYQGGAAGLLDADTNMTYAVKYLAGAYQAAHGNADRAVAYYASGYYYVAKQQGEANTAMNGAQSFASAAGVKHTGGFSAAAQKMQVAHAQHQNVASSTNPYTGKQDYF